MLLSGSEATGSDLRERQCRVKGKKMNIHRHLRIQAQGTALIENHRQGMTGFDRR